MNGSVGKGTAVPEVLLTPVQGDLIGLFALQALKLEGALCPASTDEKLGIIDTMLAETVEDGCEHGPLPDDELLRARV